MALDSLIHSPRLRNAIVALVMLTVLALSIAAAALFTQVAGPRGQAPPTTSAGMGTFRLEVPANWPRAAIEGLGAAEADLYIDPRRPDRRLIVARMTPPQFPGLRAALDDATQRFAGSDLVRSRWQTQRLDAPLPAAWRMGQSTDGVAVYNHTLAVVQGSTSHYLAIAMISPASAPEHPPSVDAELVQAIARSVQDTAAAQDGNP